MPDALRIPRNILDGVKDLLGLSQEARDSLISALSEAPQFAPVSSLVPIVREALDVSNDQAGQLLLAALSVIAQVESPEWPTKRVADEVVKSEDLKLSDDERADALRFLIRIMELPAAVTSAKASDLLTEHERIFADARIFTDVRPVFMEDPEKLANGVVIVNTLKIQHHDSSGLSSYYVSLDTVDLKALKKVVDRALSKMETLEARLSDAGVEFFVAEDDEEA